MRVSLGEVGSTLSDPTLGEFRDTGLDALHPDCYEMVSGRIDLLPGGHIRCCSCRCRSTVEHMGYDLMGHMALFAFITTNAVLQHRFKDATHPKALTILLLRHFEGAFRATETNQQEAHLPTTSGSKSELSDILR